MCAYAKRLAHRRENFGGDLRNVVGLLKVSEQHHILVTANAGNGVACTHAAFYDLCDGSNDLIAHTVTQAVIDALEVVEIKKQNSQRAPGALSVGDGLIDPVIEQVPVGQTRQGVEVGVALNLLLMVNTLRHIAFDGNEVGRLAVLIVYRREVNFVEELRAVLAVVAQHSLGRAILIYRRFQLRRPGLITIVRAQEDRVAPVHDAAGDHCPFS